jgi:hypothetical protein
MNTTEIQKISALIKINDTNLKQQIIEIIEHLSVQNPELLMSLLYYLDIDENKIQFLLKNQTDNAAETIAQLIIEREIKKQETRKLYNNKDYSDYEDTL